LNASIRLMAFCHIKLLRKNQEKYQRMHFYPILVMDILFLINLRAELLDFRSKRQLLQSLSEKSWSAVMISYLDTEKFRAIRTTLKDCFQRSLLKIQLLKLKARVSSVLRTLKLKRDRYLSTTLSAWRPGNERPCL